MLLINILINKSIESRVNYSNKTLQFDNNYINNDLTINKIKKILSLKYGNIETPEGLTNYRKSFFNDFSKFIIKNKNKEKEIDVCKNFDFSNLQIYIKILKKISCNQLLYEEFNNFNNNKIFKTKKGSIFEYDLIKNDLKNYKLIEIEEFNFNFKKAKQHYDDKEIILIQSNYLTEDIKINNKEAADREAADREAAEKEAAEKEAADREAADREAAGK